MHTLYTVGYDGWTLEGLAARVESLGALLVDVRFNPSSPEAEWRKATLQRRFGEGYTHCKALGNVNYRTGGPIKLVEPEVALPALREWLEQRPVILMCVCEDVEMCHRKVATRYMAERLDGLEIVHLEPEEGEA
jgi:uncharacterized protein (DUF488 family)